MKPAAVTSYAGSDRSTKGDRMNPHPDPQVEFFDRTAVPSQIQELLDERREIDPGTAWLIRAAVMSYDPRQRRHALALLNARAEVAQAVRSNRRY